MSAFLDILRERSVPCVFCTKPTWTLNPVCRSPRCRAADERSKKWISARAGLPPTGSRGARVVAANGSAAAATRSFDPGPEVHAASVTAPASGPRSCP